MNRNSFINGNEEIKVNDLYNNFTNKVNNSNENEVKLPSIGQIF
jgi:hypothetical protein